MKQPILLCLLLLAGRLCAQDLHGSLLYSVSNNGHDSIYALARDGRTQTYVTEGFSPRVSRNGKVMAFTRNTARPNDTYGAWLWLRDLTTGQDTVIYQQNDYLNYYDFMPSDKRLAFSEGCGVYSVPTKYPYTVSTLLQRDCYDDGPIIRLSDSLIVFHNVNQGLYRMKANGDSVQLIPNTVPGDVFPVWSANGQWVAYGKSGASGNYVVHNLYKIRPDGTDSTRLTRLPVTDTLAPDPVWAQDQNSIYVLGRIGGVAGLYNIRADGSLAPPYLIKRFNPALSINRYSLGLADSLTSDIGAVNSIALRRFSLTLAPNPASGAQVQISFTAPGPSPRLELLDATGKSLRTLAAAQGKAVLDTRSLKPGLYLIRLQADAGTQVERLIVE